MYSVNDLGEIVKNYFLSNSFNSKPENLYSPINYILSIGGKRIRPILTLAACNIFSDDIQDAIKPAIAVEVFHNFTLVHDDIMDNADIRRGKQTIHKRWNSNIAILSGDAMTILAYQLLSEVDVRHVSSVLKTFNSFALGICEGQQYDMDFENFENVSREEYLKMIELKTAILLKGALQIGAIVGNAASVDVENIGEFGKCLGLTFQLQDDLLDTYGDTKTFGKNIGGDIVAGKKTILTVETINRLNLDDKPVFNQLIGNLQIDREEKIRKVLSFYEKVGVKNHVESLINKYFDDAFEAFDRIQVPDERKVILKEISQNLMQRNR